MKKDNRVSVDVQRDFELGDLGRLVREIRLTYYQINQIFLISGLDVKGNSAAYGIMSDLYHWGPKSVPQLLKERAITRQSLHRMIQALMADELVEYIDNASHKRSKKVALTEKGTGYFVDKQNTVVASLRPVYESLSNEQVKAALDTVLAIRAGFDDFIESVSDTKD